MPTGVTVSHEGRVFVNFPRWGDGVEFTVAELKDGPPVPYPNAEVNRPGGDAPKNSLISVQSVVVDPKNRLWILDTGRIEFRLAPPRGPKLVCVDLEQNAIHRRLVNGHLETIVHDPRVLWPDTLSMATNGHLYFTANQMHRQPSFHNGNDLREKPYVVFRIAIDAKPVLLK